MMIKLPVAVAVALVCGVVPLVLGCGIFLVWCASGSAAMTLAGALNIYLGLAMFVVGVIALVWYFFRAASEREEGGIGLACVAVVLLLANFPVCALVMQGVFRVDSGRRALEELEQRTLHVVNVSGTAANELRPENAGFRSISLPSGNAASFALQQSSGETDNVRATIGDKKLAVALPSAGNSRRGEDLIVVLLADGTAQVVELRRMKPFSD